VVVVGPSGAGETHLLMALGYKVTHDGSMMGRNDVAEIG
jgi:DNA replication protein DnaC